MGVGVGEEGVREEEGREKGIFGNLWERLDFGVM